MPQAIANGNVLPAPAAPPRPLRSAVFGALAHEYRRAVVRALIDRSPVPTAELARTLVANGVGRSSGTSAVEPSDGACVRERLERVHVPKLQEAGLVNRTGSGLVPTDDPAYEDERFRALLSVDTRGCDDVLAALANRRRRIVLSALRRSGDEVTCSAIARAIKRYDPHPETTNASIRSLRTDLYHVQLPLLEDAALVEFDSADRTARHAADGAIEDDWLGTDADAVWTLRGRDSILARCRALGDGAEEELVVLTSEEYLLDGASITCLRDALERDVEVYFGTFDDDLDGTLCDELPGAEVWKPSRESFADEVGPDELRSVVFADREAMLVETRSEATGGTVSQTAITACGGANPLVVSFRELLGPALGSLEAGDGRSRIPL